MNFCTRYPHIIARFDRFWTGQDTDRPLLFVGAPKDNPDTSVSPPPAVDPRERWRPEHVLAQARYRLATTAYYGEGFPHFFVNFGPGVLHACIGGDADFQFGDTTWWPQFLSDIEEYPKLRFQPDGTWWPRIISVTEALLDELGDQLVVSLTDIGGAADVLAGAVGRRLLTDVLDRPEVVKAAIEHIHPLWIEAYERNYAVISRKQDVTTPWWPVASRGKTYMTQCDFNALISPELFKGLFAGELGAIYRHLDNGAYHLDGIGTEGHVPALLALEGLHCIQWVPAPETSALRHARMLREIQEAGVSITFNIAPYEVEQACKEFDPRRLMLNVWCESEQQAKELVDNAPRWCQRGSGGGLVRERRRWNAMAAAVGAAPAQERVSSAGRINAFLDRYILPYPVRFLTNRFIILVTIALLIPLIVFARKSVFVLAMNSYLNTMSVAVSSIVLLYATLAEIRDRQIAAMQEQRAQEDHQHVVEMHHLVLENMDFQHQEIENLKRILGELAKISLPATKLPHGAETDLRALHASGRDRFDRNVKREVNRQARSPFTRKGD